MTEKLTEREITKETAIQIDGQDDKHEHAGGFGEVFSRDKNKKLRRRFLSCKGRFENQP